MQTITSAFKQLISFVETLCSYIACLTKLNVCEIERVLDSSTSVAVVTSTTCARYEDLMQGRTK